MTMIRIIHKSWVSLLLIFNIKLTPLLPFHFFLHKLHIGAGTRDLLGLFLADLEVEFVISL